MARPWQCRLGLHRWQRVVNDAGQAYRHCERCGRDDDPKSGIRAVGG